MTDIHSHVLPGVDDGSRSVGESLKMLDAAVDQSVDTIAATPHFYAHVDSPDVFLKRRNDACELLKNAVTERHPKILLGAEVYFFEGIHRSEAIMDFRIEGTNLLLIEMPFSRWTDHMINEILLLNEERDCQVVLAHIERYLTYQKKSVLEELIARGILIQSNAEFFISKKTRRKALKLLRQKKIHFLGSDCHNTDSRPQNVGEAYEIIGSEGRDFIGLNAERHGLLRA